jgi:hypothetical protein
LIPSPTPQATGRRGSPRESCCAEIDAARSAPFHLIRPCNHSFDTSSPCCSRRWPHQRDLGLKTQPKHPGPVAETLAGPPGSDGFELRPPWLVRVASAGDPSAGVKAASLSHMLRMKAV